MRHFASLVIIFLLACIAASATRLGAEHNHVEKLLQPLRQVGPQGEGHREAGEAWRRLAQVDAAQLPAILAGMDGAHLLAMNWIHAAVDSIAERAVREGKPLPRQELERFIEEKQHNPRARRLAFEWLERVDPSARERLIPGMLNDPSLELRRDAVALSLKKAAVLEKAGRPQEAAAAYRTSLTAARDLDQIETANHALKKLGVQIDLPTHFGFITRWKLIGPFDNTNLQGFHAVYPPEVKVDLLAEYEGKVGEVAWIDVATEDPYGVVDLNKALGKHNGVAGYAYSDFFSPTERDIELRLGSTNANKIWLNGRLLTANEVYHSNSTIDQYIGRGRLKKGRNAILVKICQNEQTEDWAQNWQFQLRACDELGTAVLSESAVR
jgi:hypothetical protein